MDLDSQQLGIRTHDLNHGLTRVSNPLVEVHCRTTKTVGAAAQLSSLIADQDVVSYQGIVASAAELHMPGELVDKALDLLEEVGFIRRVKRGSKSLVEVRATGIRDRYKNLGDAWKDGETTNIEELTLLVFDDLADLPRARHELQSKYDLTEEEMSTIEDIGLNAGVLGAYSSPATGEKIWFSPIFWSDKPDELFSLNIENEDIASAIGELRGYTGLPDTMLKDTILAEVIETGIFPMPAIDTPQGRHQFAFLPPKGLKIEEKPIADKAMTLVACARYAEHFAKRKLRKDPVILLTALRRNKGLNPHSEVQEQWGPLAALRVVRIEPAGSGFHRVRLIDTPENLKALDFAIEMFSVGEVEFRDEHVEQARQLVIPGMYDHQSPARVKFRESAKHSSASRDTVHSLISGVSPDILR